MVELDSRQQVPQLQFPECAGRQFLFDHVRWQLAPPHAAHDERLFHRIVVDEPFALALLDPEFAAGGPLPDVADDDLVGIRELLDVVEVAKARQRLIPL